MLTATPGVCGGRIRIDGTRITVHRIATLYKQGQSDEDIFQIAIDIASPPRLVPAAQFYTMPPRLCVVNHV